jgi:Mn-containing catalase
VFKHEDVMLFPVEVTGSDPRAAAMLQEQFGGANGELKALLQYFVQSFGTVDPLTRQLLLNVAKPFGNGRHRHRASHGHGCNAA